jgi:septal ring factor EnvC (AmiA/AmiB activator)
MKHISVILLFLSAAVLQAQNKKAANLQSERQTIMNDIENTQQLIDQNKTSLANAVVRLSLIDQKISSQKKLIRALGEEINALDLAIGEKETQIALLEKDIQQRKAGYAETVRKIYVNKKNQKDNLLFILSADNFVQSFHRVRYLKEYSFYSRKLCEDIIDRQKQTQKEKVVLLNSKREKFSLLEEKKSQERKLLEEEKTRQADVRYLEKNKKALLQELKIKQQQADALNSQITRFLNEETKKSAQSAKTEKREAEIQGGYAMTPAEKKLSADFGTNRGRLPMPIKGKYKIVKGFGQYKFSGAYLDYKGIDIETTAENNVCAVFDGVVKKIVSTPGYYYTVAVQHGNYTTIYSNVGRLAVAENDRVKAGQTIGKIAETTLYFQIYKEGKPIDPQPWLNK